MKSNKEFEIYHWQFSENDGVFECYEKREGDIIGYLNPGEDDVPQTIEGLEQYLSQMTEDEIFDWISGTIEWY